LRICLVNTFHYRRGGDCTYAFDLAALLRSKGHEVVHFAMKHPENVDSEYSEFFVDHVDFAETFRSKNPLSRVRAFARSLYSPEAREKFCRLLDETAPDIVHLQNFRRHLTFSIVGAAKARGLPVVFTAHDYDPICPNSLLLAGGRICTACKGGSFYKAAFVRCKENSLSGSLAIALEGMFTRLRKYYDLIDVIITPSSFARGCLVDSGFDPQKVRVVHNFIDTSYGGRGVIYFGRLVVEKGLDVLIRSAADLPDVPVILAGDGPRRSHLEELAQELRLKSAGGNVEFLGYVDRSRLHQVVKNMMCVAMPSIWYENFPYAILEAFALGKPVVASNIGGMPEMVEDGKTGLLFEPGSARELSRVIGQLVESPERAEQMGRNARRRVEKEFDAETHYRKIMEIYGSLR
jgi:glycosyltransferase involved in cell wall biosynthesis